MPSPGWKGSWVNYWGQEMDLDFSNCTQEQQSILHMADNSCAFRILSAVGGCWRHISGSHGVAQRTKSNCCCLHTSCPPNPGKTQPRPGQWGGDAGGQSFEWASL